LCPDCGLALADQEGAPIQMHPKVAEVMAKEGLLGFATALTDDINKARRRKRKR
jgi:hypothetical protein